MRSHRWAGRAAKAVLGTLGLLPFLAGCWPDPTATTPTAALPAKPRPEIVRRPGVHVHVRTPCFGGIALHSLRWTPEGSAVFFNSGGDLFRVAADGSELLQIVPDRKLRLDGSPMTAFDISPDGTQIVYSSCALPIQPWVEHGPSITRETDAEGNEIVVINQGRDGDPPYPSDYELVRANLDGTAPERLTDSAAYDNFPAWSPDGTRIAFLSALATGRDWVWLFSVAAGDSAVQPGAVQSVVSPQRPDLPAELHGIAFHPPRWAPDSEQLAFVGRVARTDPHRPITAIFTVGADGADLRRLTDAVSAPSWSPDGQRIAFAKPDGDDVALYTISADGSDLKRVTTITGWHPQYGDPDPALAWIENVAWSPNGTKILYTCSGICVVTADGAPVGDAPLRGNHAAWSPDGSRIAVAEVQQSGRREINVYSVEPDGSDMRDLANSGEFASAMKPASSGATELDPCTAGFVVPAPAANAGLVEDCQTLLELLIALLGEGRERWLRNSPIEVWPGIRVTGTPPRVTALTLLGHRLDGTIPFELGTLAHLQTLDLSFNQLTGPIPAELGKLTRLAHLDLSWNELSGPIPAELGQLVDLEVLSLEGNRLTGCITPSLQSVPEHDLSTLGLPDCG